MTHFYLGRYDEALAEFKLFQEQAPESPWKVCVAELCTAMVEERLGKQGTLRQAIERWEAEPTKRKLNPTMMMAVGYAQLADRERALDWLELQYVQRPEGRTPVASL